jgi:hypothetical protein
MKRNPGKGSFARCVKEVSRRGGVDDPRAVCAASKMRAGEDLQAARRKARNPVQAAAEAFERFHGYPPDGELIFDSVEHEHEYYSGIGRLIELVIVPEGQRKGIQLYGFGPAHLAMNEAMTQLYIVGGDQELDSKTLGQFGIDTALGHEQEILGKCVDITYYTDKTHLGKDGGKADYVHAFGEETAKGKKTKLRILVSPTATYDVTNQIIGLWGGKYTIEEEGIRN